MADQRVEPRLLRGFRDYLPEDMIPRQKMLTTIADVFERHGFAPLATPALEYSEVVLGKYGVDAEKLLFRFEDNGGRDVCMRYELTASLARVAAQYGQLPRPFKVYQIGPVWRADRPGQGRYREFYQCDVDIVGSSGVLAEYECVQVAYDVLTALGVERFVVRIGNRMLLDGLAAMLGFTGDDQKHTVGRTIDKLPSQGEQVVRELLAGDAGLTDGQIDDVFGLIGIKGANSEILDGLRDYFASTPAGLAGVDTLDTILGYAAAAGVPDGFLQIDTSIVRGLDYYTGTVYETFLLDMPDLGSVMSGGRYDGLVGVFTGRDIPAVGISVGIDRLLAGLAELGMVDSSSSVAEVLVTVFDDSTASASVSVSSALRSEGLAVETSPEPGRLGKQFKYADRKRIPFAIVIGPDEMDGGTLTLRSMTTGEQHTCEGAGEAATIIRDSAGS